MDEVIYRDRFGDEIVLAETVRATVALKHPEVAPHFETIQQVLATPDEIRRSVRDDRSVLYYKYLDHIFEGKWFVVVVKRIDRNYVSTVYITERIKAGEILWKR